MKKLLLIDGPNVLLVGNRNTGKLRIKSALYALAKKILDSQSFNGCILEIFCDCKEQKPSKIIADFKQAEFCLIFCPKHQGGADQYLFNRAALANKSRQKTIVVTNDRGLRMRILFSSSIKRSFLIEVLTVEEFRQSL
jgi:predicted RNA-binding protein with PIN domain